MGKLESMEELKKRFEKSKNFQPYISSIVFPEYKNIYPGTELTLDFPLTLLIGKNGTNKSSVLHALYGCPEGKSTGEYWFATYIDPIASPAYFYRYKIPETGDTAEVLKTIIDKKIPSKNRKSSSDKGISKNSPFTSNKKIYYKKRYMTS